MSVFGSRKWPQLTDMSGTRYDVESDAPMFYEEALGKPLDQLASRDQPRKGPAPSGESWQEDFEHHLRSILRDRERGAVNWQERARVTPLPVDAGDEEHEAHARRVAVARFARRMVDGDRHAWGEVLNEELRNENLPAPFSFWLSVDDAEDGIDVAVLLPLSDIVETLDLPTMEARRLYEDYCCGLLLRFAHEALRVIPDVSTVRLFGVRDGRDLATGHEGREVLLRLLVERANLERINLDHADPSTCFEALGGDKKTNRGELASLPRHRGERR